MIANRICKQLLLLQIFKNVHNVKILTLYHLIIRSVTNVVPIVKLAPMQHIVLNAILGMF